jgi:hypothetical protein
MAESGSARGRERHAAFVGFDLGRDSNDHRIPPLFLSGGSQTLALRSAHAIRIGK